MYVIQEDSSVQTLFILKNEALKLVRSLTPQVHLLLEGLVGDHAVDLELLRSRNRAYLKYLDEVVL